MWRSDDVLGALGYRLKLVVDKMADGEVLFPMLEPEVTVSALLTLADQRRMDAEQDSEIHLIQGILDQTAREDRKDVARQLLTAILHFRRERAATTTAFFDALARRK